MVFCNQCGGGLIDGVCPKCTQAATQQAAPDNRFKDFFMNPKEKLVCTLGNTYVQNFLAGREVSQGFSVVSDKRVYFKGTTYFVEGKKVRKMKESRTVDLKDVTGTSVTTITNILVLIIGWALTFFQFISVLLMGVMGGQFGYIIGSLFTAALVLPICYAIYNFKKITLLKIEYAGGCIGVNVKLFPMQESEDFQKLLRIAKDKAIEESENATANAVTAAMSQMTAVQPVAVGAPVAAAPVSGADELMKYADLLEKGLISREEFDEYKAALKR